MPTHRQRLQRSRVVPRILQPGTVENAVRVPVCAATKAALTMLTVQYARSLGGILINAADPGYTGTDFNDHRGTQTVTEGPTNPRAYR
jgi:NAD(P)-dependent dehydrogenase (short-subunit alcohol dehydrogenase family)